jgi:hypothetical protein
VLIFRKAQFTPPLGHRDPFKVSVRTHLCGFFVRRSVGTDRDVVRFFVASSSRPGY